MNSSLSLAFDSTADRRKKRELERERGRERHRAGVRDVFAAYSRGGC